MLNPTTPRRWTIATWLLADVDDDEAPAVAGALQDLSADVVAIQSASQRLAEGVAEALRARATWALSHYRSTPMIRSSAVGLAVITLHTVRSTEDAVISEASSRWSRKRRIAQRALVERADKSAYDVIHSAKPFSGAAPFGGNAPRILIRPVQVGVDIARAIEPPSDVRPLESATMNPLAGRAALAVVTFEADWVAADFPTA